MTDILTTKQGRDLVALAQRWLGERRASRFWKRNFVVALEAWRNGGTWEPADLVGALNITHDDELLDLYRFLGTTGALPYTVTDLEFWVDQVNGSDVTGIGSQARPFSTTNFLDYLPPVIRHHVRVIFTTDASIWEINTSRFIFEEEGFISFIGRAVPVVKSSGHIVTASPGSTLLASTAQFINLNPIAPWLEDELRGWWIQKTDGVPGQMNWAMPIVCNGTDYLIQSATGPGGPFLVLSPGDEFALIRPRLTLTLEKLVINHKQPEEWTNATGARNRVVFANMNINVQNANAQRCAAFLAPVNLYFVSLIGGTTFQSRVNVDNSKDSAIENLAQSGIPNINPEALGFGPNVEHPGAFLDNSGFDITFDKDAWIKGCVIRGGFVRLNDRAVFQYGGSCSMGIFQARPAQQIDSVHIYMERDDESAFWVSDSYATLKRCSWTTEVGNLPKCGLWMLGTSFVTLESYGIDALLPGSIEAANGILFGDHTGAVSAVGNVYIDWDPTSPTVSLSGSVSDIVFADAVPTTETMPIANNARFDQNTVMFVVRGYL